MATWVKPVPRRASREDVLVFTSLASAVCAMVAVFWSYGVSP